MTAHDTSDQNRLLGDFIRAHRERLGPEGSMTRRRTPGLRREELAAKAGISTTWLSWIEQGRGVKASPQALTRLARAMALSRAERGYLFELAGMRDPESPAADPTGDAPASIAAAVRAVRHPAYGLDRLWNASAWNDPAAHLFEGWLSAGAERNLLLFVFLDPKARNLIPNWKERARRLLAEFRSDYGHSFADPRARELVQRLRRDSFLFREAWDAQDVREREGGLRSFHHPKDGLLQFVQHTFSPSDRPDHKLVILTPA
jgi:transcriptional regulator with XRE-family HTH domain